MKPGRCSCIVPGCRRTKNIEIVKTVEGPVPFDLWICSKHWEEIPRDAKRVYRRARRAFIQNPAGNHARTQRIWAWLQRRAIERSAGI